MEQSKKIECLEAMVKKLLLETIIADSCLCAIDHDANKDVHKRLEQINMELLEDLPKIGVDLSDVFDAIIGAIVETVKEATEEAIEKANKKGEEK